MGGPSSCRGLCLHKTSWSPLYVWVCLFVASVQSSTVRGALGFLLCPSSQNTLGVYLFVDRVNLGPGSLRRQRCWLSEGGKLEEHATQLLALGTFLPSWG